MTNNSTILDDKIKEYNELYSRAISGRDNDGMYVHKKRCEEFYYNDVENTLSQYTQKQFGEIKRTFNIPVSTKICYPIVEQVLAFLTGMKPFPRLIAAQDVTKEFVESIANIYHAIWYESRTDREVSYAIRDMLNTGSGFILTREADFYSESTFNVVHKYLPWKKVLIDPDTTEPDLKDCGYVIIQDVLRTKKAERRYGIRIDEDDAFSNNPYLFNQYEEDFNVYGLSSNLETKDKYVFIREYYILKEVNVFISENGDISTKRPKLNQVPNPKLAEIDQQIAEIKAQVEQMITMAQSNQVAMQSENMQNKATADSQDMGLSSDIEESTAILQGLLKQRSQEPEEISAYIMQTEDEREIIAYDIRKETKKRVKYVIMVGSKIIEEKYMAIDRLPVIHFCIMMRGKINRTYGLVHFMRDLIQAMNKFESLLLLDMMMNANRKIIMPEGAVDNIRHFEERWAVPGAVVTYIPNPALERNGKPEIQEPSPLNQSIQFVLQHFLQLIEYITGINSIVQGNPAEAPATFGATQSLQVFGTQRVKLYARGLESSFEELALITVQFIQNYTPVDKELKYFDNQDNPDSLMLIKEMEDVQFKVRVTISQSLPTVRMMASQLLAIVAGQTKNQFVADFLTENMLKLMDLPEGDKLAEQLNMVKQMSEQIGSLQEQLKGSEQKIKMLENNFYSQALASKVEIAATKAKSDIEITKNNAVNDINNSESSLPQGTDDTNQLTL